MKKVVEKDEMGKYECGIRNSECGKEGSWEDGRLRRWGKARLGDGERKEGEMLGIRKAEVGKMRHRAEGRGHGT